MLAGRDKKDKDSIIMSNMSNAYDIPILYKLAPKQALIQGRVSLNNSHIGLFGILPYKFSFQQNNGRYAL